MHTPDAKPIRRPTCPEHGGALPCPVCNVVPMPDGFMDSVRAALDAAKTTHHQRDAEKAAREARRADD